MRNTPSLSRFTLVALSSAILHTATCGAATSSAPRPISLLPGMGDLHHPVSTTNLMAQRFFNQGLTFIFGFNHDAAIRSFRRALEYDPNLAMAHWGIGLALGPNINLPVSAEAEKAAYDATQRALALAGRASEPERDYITALATRYSIEPNADLKTLDKKYSQAMARLVEKYPDDLDAAALCAESLMNLRPWQYWNEKGQPAEETLRVVEILESILRRDPHHPGANHYYIHALEASPFPERALPSAARLETYAPSAGHLVHMPAHIYIRVGDYQAAARRNEIASEVDFDYIQSCGVQGVYPAMYTSHNLHFAAVAHTLQGRYAPARRYSERLLSHVRPFAESSPEFEAFLPTLEQILAAFGRWDEILALPAPEEKFKLHRAIWHFARGLATAATGKPGQAESEAAAIATLRNAVGNDAGFGPFNKARDIFAIAENQVLARIALARGDAEESARLLRTAVPIEDALRYMEPPDWYLSTREALGGALLTAGKFAEAETVFREDLARNHRKGRSLYGLEVSLRKQGKQAAARLVQRAFEKAWENADSPLEPANVWWLNAN